MYRWNKLFYQVSKTVPARDPLILFLSFPLVPIIVNSSFSQHQRHLILPQHRTRIQVVISIFYNVPEAVVLTAAFIDVTCTLEAMFIQYQASVSF